MLQGKSIGRPPGVSTLVPVLAGTSRCCYEGDEAESEQRRVPSEKRGERDSVYFRTSKGSEKNWKSLSRGRVDSFSLFFSFLSLPGPQMQPTLLSMSASFFTAVVFSQLELLLVVVSSAAAFLSQLKSKLFGVSFFLCERVPVVSLAEPLSCLLSPCIPCADHCGSPLSLCLVSVATLGKMRHFRAGADAAKSLQTYLRLPGSRSARRCMMTESGSLPTCCAVSSIKTSASNSSSGSRSSRVPPSISPSFSLQRDFSRLHSRASSSTQSHSSHPNLEGSFASFGQHLDKCRATPAFSPSERSREDPLLSAFDPGRGVLGASFCLSTGHLRRQDLPNSSASLRRPWCSFSSSPSTSARPHLASGRRLLASALRHPRHFFETLPSSFSSSIGKNPLTLPALPCYRLSSSPRHTLSPFVGGLEPRETSGVSSFLTNPLHERPRRFFSSAHSRRTTEAFWLRNHMGIVIVPHQTAYVVER